MRSPTWQAPPGSRVMQREICPHGCSSRARCPSCQPEDLGEEHQELHSEIADAVRQWELAEGAREGMIRELRAFDETIEQLQEERSRLIERGSSNDLAQAQILSCLSADAQQLLAEAGVVQLGEQLYSIQHQEGGHLALRACNPLRLGEG